MPLNPASGQCIYCLQNKVRKMSRECHNHKPQPFSDTKEEETDKAKQTQINYRGFKAFLQLANFTLDPDATLNTEIHKNSIHIKASNSVNA